MNSHSAGASAEKLLESDRGADSKVRLLDAVLRAIDPDTSAAPSVTPLRYPPAMLPAAAIEEPCPCGSDQAFVACCGSARSPPSRLSRAALETWARGRGIEEQLRVLANAAATAFAYRGDPRSQWMHYAVTVGDILAAFQPRDFGARFLQGARAAACAFLLDELAAVREGVDEEQRPPPPPQHPTLALVFDRLRALRSEVRAVAMPRALARLGHCTLHVEPNARTVSFVERRKVERHDAARVDPSVVLSFARVREEPIHAPPCSCGAGRPCTHVLAAIDLVLAELAKPSRSATWDALARAIDTPDWCRALEAIDVLHASRRRADDTATDLVSFRIRELPGGTARVVAYRHRRRRDGLHSKGQPLRTRELAERADRFRPEDRAALGRLGYLAKHPYGYGYGYGGYDAPVTRPGDLAVLAGHPRVYLEDDPESPCAVEHARLGFALRHDTGGLELIAVAGDEPIPADALLGHLSALGSDASFLRVDPARRRVLVVTVPDPDAAEAVAAALAEHGHRFPAEAESALLERLGGLQELLPVDVPPGLEGDEVRPGGHQVVRLGLREVGLELEVLARPLDGVAARPPGEGPARLVVARAEGRTFTVRDFTAERRAAGELLAGLSLPDAAGDAPFRRAIADDEAALALLERLRTLEHPDVSVEWAGAPPRVSRASSSRALRVKVRDRHDWFGLEGEVELDGERVKLALVLDALRNGRRVIRLEGGAWLELTGALAERLAPLAHLSSAGGDGVEIGPGALGVLDDLARDGASLATEGAFAALHERMRAASGKSPRVPRAFAKVLRDYQVDGFRWLARLAEWGAGAVLADDMGLGKTLQALALLCHRAKDGPALVVAPTSVCANWVNEARRFAPALNVVLFRESERAEVVAALGPGDVLVVSYGLLVLDLERFREKRFATLVLDEAQAVKNAATRRARAARELDAAFRVALSGTPVENHLGELWSLYRIVFPGLLGRWELFRRQFALPIERDGDDERRRALAATVRPFLLRRTKAEVARELPSRTEIALPVALSPAEQRGYEQARLAAVARLAASSERARPEQQRFQVLAAITELRLLACHPRLRDPDSTVPSSKLARFLELAEELVEGGHRALVFSQFTSHLALAREALERAGRSTLYLDGQTPAAQRDRLVERFQAGEGELFLISLKAGGTGLNLTAADYVIHLDPWWNPAVEDQATDRVHRIGQQRPVTVYRLISQGTIEETIVTLHARKRELVAGVLDGMDAAGRLSSDELVALIRATPGADAGGTAAEDAPATASALEVEAEGAAADTDPTLTDDPASGAGALPHHAGALPPSGATVDHAGVLAGFREHVLRELERGRWHTTGPVKSYPRAVQRFLDYLSAERIRVTSLADELAQLVPGYLEALRTGRFPAPASEPIVARSALGELARFLRAE